MNSETLSNCTLGLNLSIAREILLREATELMPKSAAPQRDDSLRVIESMIEGCIANAGLALAEMPPASNDTISKKAHAYLTTLPQGDAPAQLAFGTAYAALSHVFYQISNLDLAGQIIEWVQSTHAFADIAPSLVEDASAALSIASQRLLLQPDVATWAKQAQNDALTPDELCNARLMKEAWIMKAGMSEEFVGELSRVNSASFRSWEQAKPQSDFAAWLPYFTEVVDCAKRKAGLLGAALGVSPYQAMLEQYNAGLKNETVNDMFGALQENLPKLIQTIMKKQASEQPPLALPAIALPKQRHIIQRIIDALGFEPDFSRLDESMHPFSTGEWDDVRVTTHYHEHNLLSGIMGVVHEMGHLFYSRNLPRLLKHQMIGTAQSMWIHESQSLFWEKQIGCSMEFVELIADFIREETGESPALAPANLHRLITRVKPSFIRIEADEVTYPAHIILRHAIEQQIVAGTLAPADLPHVWAEQMQQLLGLVVPDHAHGCMQDVHWSDGSFGYFPAYSFGALAAAQFMEAARAAIPDMAQLIRSGKFAPIQQWLRQNIHEMGSRYDGEELVRRVTGKPLSITPWLAHIQRRYL